MVPALLLQDNVPSTGGWAAMGGTLIVCLVISVVFIVAMWKVYAKAGQPGWAVLIPIYNLYIMTKIAGRPGWWVVLMFIPFVNLVIAILLAIDIAKSFGKGAGFGVVMLFLLCGLGYLILGFGSSRYLGPAALTAK